MEEQKYLAEIRACRDQLNQENADEILARLEALEKLKPVRAEWYLAKAEAVYLKTGDAGEVNRILAGKVWDLYNYDGVCEINEFYLRVDEEQGYDMDWARTRMGLALFRRWWGIANEEDCLFAKEKEEQVAAGYQRFLAGDHTKERLKALFWNSHLESDFVAEVLYDALSQRLYSHPSRVFGWVRQISNMGYLTEKLDCQEETPVIVAAQGEGDRLQCLAAAHALTLLGRRVCFVDAPVRVQTEGGISIEDTLAVTLENCEERGRMRIFRSVELSEGEGEEAESNIDHVIQKICQEYVGEGCALILCAGVLLDALSGSRLLRKQMGRLYSFRSDYTEERTLSFGWVGNYLAYISELYCIDATAAVAAPSRCHFSIVLPARGSAATLEYTLKTCLEQRYEGDFEVIISDNSPEGCHEIRELCREMEDPRIVYVKTPRNLQLAKSFEFAILQARGDYVLTLGADDALLPWTLEVLEEVTRANPKEEIIQWDRGFYAWPGFNGGQENQFVIPGSYRKGEYGCSYRERNQYLASILKQPQSMYLLPTLYINSCFKRSYLQTLMDRTGRLWDGICQDLYMGVVTAVLHDRILYLSYPLAIAGMSGNSVGARSKTTRTTSEDFDKEQAQIHREQNVGGYCMSGTERLLPATGTDTDSLYLSLLRAVTIGLLSEKCLTEVFDWKQFFLNLAGELDVRDVVFDRKVHEMRYAAMWQGEEFLAWFDEKIYHRCLVPRIIDEKKIQKSFWKKTYQEGPIKGGGKILDASKRGVRNVWEAARLFSRETGL